ncbi:MAG: inositol-3-phosphate synthase [Thermoproteota archaeon]|jgi:myo-inositol-1-phosphate synthase|nr:inositol-3-phosphate synthase [Thermoproteota archaeon]
MQRKIRVAIIGVGNSASALVQGVHYYKNVDDDKFVPGLMHVRLGGYHVGDIEFVAAFDIDKNKVGKDLSEAIFQPPNCTIKFAEVPKLGVEVMRGMTHDSLGKYLQKIIEKHPSPTVDVADVLKSSQADLVINYLPVGSESATKWYVEQALEARVGFINAIPVFIAREKRWQEIFYKRNVPIIGDDVKSQLGATILHRTLVKLFVDRGIKIDRTFQLNIGGDTDFLNMLERERLESKKISKTQAVTSLIPYDIGEDNIHIGPSDYVKWLQGRKWAYIRIEGRGFGDAPINIELKLEVWDAPNSAGIVIDAIRCMKLALDRGIGGPLISPSAYFMKSPPIQYPDEIARTMLEEFIEGKRER